MSDAAMSSAGFFSAAQSDDRDSGRLRPAPAQVALVWALTFGALYLAIPGLFTDPFIRHDDYAALLGRADVYAGSTLAEGRWLNYWWALRPFLFDHQAIFALFHAFWALTAALLAGALFPDDRAPWRMALASVAFAFSPPMMNTALWPGTLLPGLALTAVYAAVVAYGSMRARVWALPPFVILTLMSHGSFPLLMLAMALITPGWRDAREIARIVILFGASFAAGTALIFTLNWASYGVFGLRIDAWRGATPARDLAGALEMLGRFANEALWGHTESMLHVPFPVAAAGLGAALAILLAVDRGAAARVLLIVAVVFGLQSTQAVVTGLLTPFRGQFPIWAAVVAMPLLGWRASQSIGRSAFFGAILLALIAIGNWHWGLFETKFAPYQAATRDLAAATAVLDPSGAATLFIVGDSREIPGGDQTQSSNALRYRLEMLTGRNVVMCVREPDVCAPLQAQSGSPIYPEAGFMRAMPGGGVLIRLPDTPAGKVEDPTKWLG